MTRSLVRRRVFPLAAFNLINRLLTGRDQRQLTDQSRVDIITLLRHYMQNYADSFVLSTSGIASPLGDCTACLLVVACKAGTRVRSNRPITLTFWVDSPLSSRSLSNAVPHTLLSELFKETFALSPRESITRSSNK